MLKYLQIIEVLTNPEKKSEKFRNEKKIEDISLFFENQIAF